MLRASFFERSPGEDLAEDVELDRGFLTRRSVRVREGRDVQGGRAELVVGAELGETEDAVALIGGVGGDVDERLDVRVAGRGVGDDDAAVGVAGEDDRALDRAQVGLQIGRVRRHPRMADAGRPACVNRLS
jgi:hypothetical protein